MHKSSSPELRKLLRLSLGIQHCELIVYQVCPNGESRMTLTFLWFGQICVLVAVAVLEECCMAFANMQWLFLSGERIVAHGPLF